MTSTPSAIAYGDGISPSIGSGAHTGVGLIVNVCVCVSGFADVVVVVAVDILTCTRDERDGFAFSHDGLVVAAFRLCI